MPTSVHERVGRRQHGVDWPGPCIGAPGHVQSGFARSAGGDPGAPVPRALRGVRGAVRRAVLRAVLGDAPPGARGMPALRRARGRGAPARAAAAALRAVPQGPTSLCPGAGAVPARRGVVRGHPPAQVRRTRGAGAPAGRPLRRMRPAAGRRGVPDPTARVPPARAWLRPGGAARARGGAALRAAHAAPAGAGAPDAAAGRTRSDAARPQRARRVPRVARRRRPSRLPGRRRAHDRRDGCGGRPRAALGRGHPRGSADACARGIAGGGPLGRVAAGTAATSGERAAALSARLAGELGSARALPDLFRLYELRDEVADLPALARLFDRIASDRKARADVRAAALELRAQLAVAQGQFPQARSIIERAAPVRTWAVIGPFDNDGRTGLRAVYSPETDGYDPAAKYPGKDHDVSWRTLPPQMFPLGYVDLSSAVWPAQDSAVYAATVLRSPRARIAVLHLGASGATRLWVNGKLVREDPAVHPSRWDQAAFAVELRAGDNAVLLKVAHGIGKPGFSLRICDGRDEPLRELARSARAPD